MNIEYDIFKKSYVDYDKLIKYGFIKKNDIYKYETNILDDSFTVIITYDNKITGKIIDLFSNEEYLNYRVSNQIGEFASTIREEYEKILYDIKNKCFYDKYFVSDQANRISNIILEKYNVTPEFLWEKYPDFGIFRNTGSDKWFGLIMNIDYSKVDKKKSGLVDIMNVKVDSLLDEALKIDGIYPAYHMSKKSWISIVLDDTVSDDIVLKYLNYSYETSSVVGEWIIPANPKYYDVMHTFDDTDTIIWKQSSNIKVGDLIYLYVTEPYSSIMFKCLVLESDIPYTSSNTKVRISRVIKVKLLKRYNKGDYSFEKLKDYGITSVRGPRRISSKLSLELRD